MDPHYFLEGYVSSKQLDYFVWESGFFEEGSSVIFGNNTRLEKVLGVIGVGQNYFMMGLKDSGRALYNEQPGGSENFWRINMNVSNIC